MRTPFSADERRLRAFVRAAFRGCRIYCRRDRSGFVARIDVPSGSWCSARGSSRENAIDETYRLACEPAPGFPGWVEPAPIGEFEELALT